MVFRQHDRVIEFIVERMLQMRLASLIFVGLMLSATAYAGWYGQSHKERENLKGPVHSVRVEVEDFTNQSGQWTPGKRYTLFYKEYDEKGFIIENTVLPDSPAEGQAKSAHTYDTEGRIIESRGVAPNGGKTTYTYKTKGDITEKYTFDRNTSTPSQLDVYDKNNHLLETTAYASDGSIVTRNTYHYDTNGLLIEKSSYDGAGNLTGLGRRIYHYDTQGRELQQEEFGSDGSVHGKVVSSYDDHGNKTRTFYNADGSVFAKETLTYEYDNYDNWVKQTQQETFFGKQPSKKRTITYRTITYYVKAKS